jgi:hypothetical protein
MRHAKVYVGAETVFQIISGRLLVVDGIPPTAKFVRAFFDQQQNSMCIVMSHRSFAKVREGDEIPNIYPRVEHRGVAA